MPFDSDIVSMQEARDLAVAARDAQRIWAKASQADVDRVCEAMANAAYEASERLGRMASDENRLWRAGPQKAQESICFKECLGKYQGYQNSWRDRT